VHHFDFLKLKKIFKKCSVCAFFDNLCGEEKIEEERGRKEKKW
jgi:hypothetical protein